MTKVHRRQLATAIVAIGLAVCPACSSSDTLDVTGDAGQGGAAESVEVTDAVDGNASPTDAPAGPDSGEESGENSGEESDDAVAVAVAFMEARDAGDAEASMSLLAPEAELIDFGFWPRSPEEYPGLLEWMQITQWRWHLDSCELVGPEAAGDRVGCAYTTENTWSQVLEAGVYPGHLEMVVSDGQIVELANELPRDWLHEVFDPWFEWLTEAHPDDVRTLYRHDAADSFTGGPAVTPEALDLSRAYLPEFVAAVEAE